MKRALIFIAASTVTSVFFINLCATIFRCGCASLWAGAADHCNIHTPGMRHCPWCGYGLAASYIPWGAMLAAQAVVSFSPRRMTTGVRLATAIGAFPVSGVVIAGIYGLLTGYWTR